MTAEVERLRELLATVPAEQFSPATIGEVANALPALLDRLEKAEAALEPFAKAADEAERHYPNRKGDFVTGVRLSHLRRARTVYASTGASGE